MNELASRSALNPNLRGAMEDATHVGVAGSVGDGPYVQLWLRVESGVVTKATFRTPGCPSSTVTASVLCQLITGRTVDKISELTAEDLAAVVGPLPEGKGHYIDKTIIALRNALKRGEQ